MAQQDKNIINQQLVHSYLSSVISISLVLFLMGITGLLAINAKSVSDYFKEHIHVAVVLKQDVKDADSTLLMRQVMAAGHVRDAVRGISYISREQGAGEMAELLGTDFLDVFDYNPLPASIELKLKADYVQTDSIAVMQTSLMKFSFVQEVSYEAPLVSAINNNLRRIGIVLAAVIAVLLFISFVLIHNTIRLSVYSRRFTIYTMRLVGATRSFIRKPFMVQAFIQGLISSLIAILLLMGLLYLVQKEFSGILMLVSPHLFLAVLACIVITGIMLCRISTFFVVNKVVRLDTSAFYY
jgi:cell division transport system permease protein